MSLRTEIIPYTNIDGYISGSPVQGLGRTNDNAILFTALYYITLKDRGEDVPEDRAKVASLVSGCLVGGVLVRYPGDTSIDDSYDNYIALAALCVVYGLHWIGFKVFFHGLTHFGYYNVSGTFSFRAVMWRFFYSLVPAMTQSLVLGLLQALLYAGLFVTNRVSPWILFMFLPEFLAGLTIAVSNRNEELGNSDGRKNTWLLIKAMQYSAFGQAGAAIWWNRLRKKYGDGGIRNLFLVYFQKSEYPLVKYAVNPWDKKL